MSTLAVNQQPVNSQFRRTNEALMSILNNTQPCRQFYSPGRVNLIGEHIDYCGGDVLPCAIDLGIYFSVAANDLQAIRVYSFQTKEVCQLDLLEDIRAHNNGHWFEYIKGVVASYVGELPLQGLDIAIASTIPGGGLSSSAALEVGLATIIESYFAATSPSDLFRKKAIAWRAQRVENHFVGVNCGIMDQAAVALGIADSAIKMDCRNLNIQTIPANLAPYQLIIINSNKDRKLVDSKYNERRRETEQALAVIKTAYSIDNLCDINELQKCSALALIKDSIVAKRARHVIEENIRVGQASQSLALGDLKEFGRLLYQSHTSLNELYEVSCDELNFIVEQCRELPGVVGARMTGAGFGGCAIALVHKNASNYFMNWVGKKYFQRFGFSTDFYPVQLTDGALEVTKELSYAI